MTDKTSSQKSTTPAPKTPKGVPTNRPDNGQKIGNNGMPKYQNPPPPPPAKKKD